MAERFIKVYESIIQLVGTTEAIIYGVLENKYYYYKNNDLLDSEGFMFLTVESLANATNYQRHKQKRALDILESVGLIETKIKYGRGCEKKRMFKILNNSSFWEKTLNNNDLSATSKCYHDDVKTLLSDSKKTTMTTSKCYHDDSKKSTFTTSKCYHDDSKKSTINKNILLEHNNKNILLEQNNKNSAKKKEYSTGVFLTDEEYEKLIEFIGSEAGVIDYIERLSDYMLSKGKKYKSHYATIRNWVRRTNDNQKGQSKTPRADTVNNLLAKYEAEENEADF